jgi:Holliday junction DNA helicase RuvA
MISSIQGELVRVNAGRALIRCGDITYELFIPAADEMRLSGDVGRTIALHTLHYLETQSQGASYTPRLVGFATEQDRAFFELFTTVKGLGVRKSLRALQLPFANIAQAIASRDIALLTSLPEIGKRTAETIVAELSGKVDRFVIDAPVAGESTTEPGRIDVKMALVRDAVRVLTQLGEPALTARQIVDRALAVDASLETPEDLVAAAFRLKE